MNSNYSSISISGNNRFYGMYSKFDPKLIII